MTKAATASKPEENAPEVAVVEEPVVERAKVSPIFMSRLKEAQYQRTIWEVIPEPGVAVEDLLDPAFWTHVGMRFSLRDRIEAYAEDGSYFAEYIVLSSGRNYANLALIRQVDLAKAPRRAEAKDEFVVDHGGPVQLWRVRRGHDVLKQGCQTKKIADIWLESHLAASGSS